MSDDRHDKGGIVGDKTAFGIVISLPICMAGVITFSILGYKLWWFIRDRYRRRWVMQHLLPSFQQMSYREAIELIAGRFEAPECSLCLEEFGEEEETVTVLPACNHIYRPNCIRDWLLKSTRLVTFPCCPICKSTIPLFSSPT